MTRALQAMWCIIFAIFIYEDFLIYLKSTQANLNTDLDCFMSLGAYSVCTLTVYVSICGTLFLLMAQALISRLFVPGVSIFVDSSVRCHPYCKYISHMRRRFWSPTGNRVRHTK